MAARRLIIVMVVLLGISTVAAAVAPRSGNDSGSDPANPRPGTPARGAGGGSTGYAPLGESGVERVHVRISNAATRTIFVAPGDELVLTVSGSFGDDIEIPGLGLVETMTENAPAVFDILVDEAGTFGVRAVEADRLVATIEVSEVPRKPGPHAAPQKPEGKGRPSGAAGGVPHDVQGSVPAGPEAQRLGSLASQDLEAVDGLGPCHRGATKQGCRL